MIVNKKRKSIVVNIQMHYILVEIIDMIVISKASFMCPHIGLPKVLHCHDVKA